MSVRVLLKAFPNMSVQTHMDKLRGVCEQKSTLSFIALCLVLQQEAAAAAMAITLYCLMVLK